MTGKIEWENGETLFVTDDGFVCVMTENKHYALEEVNTIFATATIAYGIPTEILESTDLCKTRFDAINNQIIITEHTPQKGRNCFSLKRGSRDQEIFSSWKSIPRRSGQTRRICGNTQERRNFQCVEEYAQGSNGIF